MEFDELIACLRHCGEHNQSCIGCPEYEKGSVDAESIKCVENLLTQAADALESQGKRIAELEAELERRQTEIMQILRVLEDGCLGVQKAAFVAAREAIETGLEVHNGE